MTSNPSSDRSASRFAPDELRQRLAEFPFWYHRIELTDGVVTPGHHPVNADVYNVPKDLTNARVLDVGAWDGFWTFEALKRGAREVVAIDDFSDNLGSLTASDRKAWENFDLCREALGYSEEQCKRIDMSVYDVSPKKLGTFDVVLFFGTIYHLRHPLLALDLLSEVCDDLLCVESAILDDYSPYQGGFGHGYSGQQVVMEFYPERQYGNNESNWWVPSLFCMAQMARSAKFDRVQAWKMVENPPPQLPFCRGFVQGHKIK